MLKASASEFVLTAADVQQALEVCGLILEGDPALELLDDEMRIRTRIASERLPIALSVELRVTIQSVQAEQVVLTLAWSNLPLLPSAIKEIVLRRVLSKLPGRYAQGLLTLDLSAWLSQIPFSFQLDALTIQRDGLRLRLIGLTLPAPGGEGAIEEAPPLMVAEGAVGAIAMHQTYYQRLREKVKQWVHMNAPAWSRPLVPWMLAVPDFFALLVRLMGDERVPSTAKVILGVAVAYFVSPIDLIFDFIPFIGHVDDVAVSLFALDQVSKRVPAAVIQEAWPGDGNVLEMIQSGTDMFGRVLPARLLAAIKRLLRGSSS